MVLWESNICQILTKQVIRNTDFVSLVYYIPKYKTKPRNALI